MTTTLTLEDISELESLLLKNGILQPASYADLKQFSQNQICLFCLKHAVYQIVTTELVDFIRAEIGQAKAIEIGSGNGCLGRSLNITITDNKVQDSQKMQTHYRAIKQPTIRYGKDVVKLDALAAIQTYGPDVVIAAWVTQKWKIGMDRGFDQGVDESLLRGKVAKYIFVGNDSAHRDKEIFGMFPHKIFKFEWLLSRSWLKEDNSIYIFDCK